MKVLLAHPGTQHAHRLAKELSDRELLQEFHTGFAIADQSWCARALGQAPASVRNKLTNRIVEGVKASSLVRHPWLEFRALRQLRTNAATAEEIFHQRNRAFQEAIPARPLAAADAVIGFDTSSWRLAEICQRAGVPFVLDQSIAHPVSKEAVYRDIALTFPEWGGSIRAHPAFLREAEDAEHRFATRISAASSFTVTTLLDHGIPPEKIWLNPYGVDARKFQVRDQGGSRAMRFLFVGAVNARKGVPLLLDAWSRLATSSAELWMVGPVSEGDRRLIGQPAGVKVLGAMPHEKIPDVMRACDVFVFPSLFEGFGLVILEAMACGLPIISTPATAAPDLYRDGAGGWIVPTGDVDALACSMQRCLERPGDVVQMGRLSREIAEGHTWTRYGDRWRENLASLRA